MVTEIKALRNVKFLLVLWNIHSKNYSRHLANANEILETVTDLH